MKYINEMVMNEGAFLVQPIEIERTNSIIVTAQPSDDIKSRGIIIKAPSKYEFPIALQEGDLVMYDKYTGINLAKDSSFENLIVLKDSMIIAAVPKDYHSEQI